MQGRETIKECKRVTAANHSEPWVWEINFCLLEDLEDLEKKLTPRNSELEPESFKLSLSIVVVALNIPAEGEAAEIFTGV